MVQIVASDQELLQMAVGMAKSGRHSIVPVVALEGISRVKGELTASIYLNDQAKSLQSNLRIAGVRAVSVDTVVNR